MTRLRWWWAAAIALDAVLWAALLALPLVMLLLPDQWQGTSVTVPPEIIVRETLGQTAPSVATAALALLAALIVVGVAQRVLRPARATEPDRLDGWSEGVVVEEARARR
ncbi:hypothetical protein Q0F99_11710 [Rathayibacter oskolensis]|uniref:hypothetical protein n=1 Tax=Rathayibacter oskolensis TaxID=1891671 RepID=UPI00265D97CF|nr:hypothetical protein [Rathayibacter oskolensis]WKK70524.1 hypothetical protein Q0F99_11710 [Rathayibacter oskolensis]